MTLPDDNLLYRDFIGGPLDGRGAWLHRARETYWTQSGVYHLRAGRMYFLGLLPTDWKPRRYGRDWKPE